MAASLRLVDDLMAESGSTGGVVVRRSARLRRQRELEVTSRYFVSGQSEARRGTRKKKAGEEAVEE